MITAVDTNVFSTIWLGEQLAGTAQKLLLRCGVEGSVVISPIVYAEIVANPGIGLKEAERFLRETRVRVDWNLRNEVWAEAGSRFGSYAQRRRVSGGGEARRMLADFVVGAHALLQADRLLTFDVKRYSVDFPELALV